MSNTTTPPAWAVERAREIAIRIISETDIPYVPESDSVCELAPHWNPLIEAITSAIASALTIPDGHVRLPSGDQSLPWKVIHVASNEVVASFKWGDVAQTYIKRGIEIGGWHEHELRLQQAAESARAGGGA